MMKMIVWLWIRDIRCLVAAVHGSKKVREVTLFRKSKSNAWVGDHIGSKASEG